MIEPDDEAAQRYRAPALDKGLDILEILAAQSEGLTRADLVKAMGRGPSEIYRMLERLVARGYVARIEGGDRYALTMKLFLLANRHPPLRRLVAQAQPVMDAFAGDTGQSCHLVVPERGVGIVVAHAAPEANWEFRIRIGAQLDLFTTGSGLTLLAFQKPERRAATLAQWGVPRPADPLAEVEPHLALIRRDGFREGPSAQIAGIVDLSAPVFAPEGDAAAVLTCPYIEQLGHGAADARATALAKLRAVAASISYTEPD